MKRTIEILKQYRQADSYVRTFLFLQYPDLRDVFQDIEFIKPTVGEGLKSMLTNEKNEIIKKCN